MNIRAQKRAQAAPFGTLILGDNRTARVRITVPRMDGNVDLSDLTWIINITSADGKTDVVPAEDVRVDAQDIAMSYIVGGVATAAVGNTRIMIEGVNDTGSVWRSAEYYLRIDDAATAEPSEDDAQRLTALQELMLYVEGNLNAVIEAGDRAREAYQHPPVIGENGNWYVWDWQAKTYVDSGKPSQGGSSGGGGAAGKNGGYYVPHVDDAGNLTWTPSDGSMPPVEGANIKGKDGEDAPADVVRYGAQTLDDAQKQQARDNIGAAEVEGVYELIETIVLEEDTVEIVRTAEPDGTPYNCKAFAFRFTAPQTSITAGLHMRLHASVYGYVDIAMPSLIGGDIRKTTVFVYDKFGYWYADGYMPSVSYSNCNISFSLAPNYMNKIPSSMPIIKLWISVYGSDGVGMPAGTTIEIWGVRA